MEDVELDGQTVAAGDVVVARIDAANRDPAVFTQPDRLDVTRDAAGHLAFGAGPHHCLGAALARAEAQAALAALLRIPELQLAVDEPAWRPIEALRSLEALPVTCRPS